MSDGTRQHPWLRIAVEAAVIVGSILLAFGIDAAWDNRGQEQRRTALSARNRTSNRGGATRGAGYGGGHRVGKRLCRADRRQVAGPDQA